MEINTKNISVFNATLIQREFTNHKVVSIDDWLEGSPSPIFLREYSRYKDLGIQILIEEASDKLAEVKSDLLVQELRTCTIKFSDMDKYFDCKFQGNVNIEKLYNGVWKLTALLNCYRTYTPEQSKVINDVLQGTVTNSGTQVTEAYITVIPSVNIAEFTITGLSKTPIRINNLIAGKTHVIDGYKFRYLKDGANDIGNYNAFEFPILQTGTKNVLFSHATADVTIKFFQKYN